MTFDETERHRAPHEQAAREAVEAALLAQGRTAARAIEKGTPVLYVLDQGTMPEVLTDVWTRTVVTFADAQLAELVPSKAWVDWLDMVREFVGRVGASLVSRITGTTRDMIRAVVTEGLEDGLSARQIADTLRDEWPQLAASRAERIARTEVIRASNYGTVEGARRASLDYGLDLRKVWVTAPVTGTERDRHALYEGLNGQAVPIDGVFRVGPYYAARPGDETLPASEAVNCRCALRFEPARRATRSWTQARNEAMQTHYEAVKGTFPNWVQAVEDVQSKVEGAEVLTLETARRICHSRR
jgi:hypothetical protein